MIPTVYIMRGMPGSGKSSLARDLAGDVGHIHSTDELSQVNGKYVFQPSKLGELHKQNYDNFVVSLENQVEIVICDNTNMQIWEFKKYVDIAKQFNYRVVIVTMPFIDINLAVERNTHDVPEISIKKMVQIWEPYMPTSPNSNKEHENNYAFIDGQNMQVGTQKSKKSWIVDFDKLYTYLKYSYSTGRMYYYIGYRKTGFDKLYKKIEDAGFILVFKSHKELQASRKKGNVDSDIIFDIMNFLYTRELVGKVILIAGDGDYFKLVESLILANKFEKILFPDRDGASTLYKALGNKYFVHMEDGDIREKLMKQKKRVP